MNNAYKLKFKCVIEYAENNEGDFSTSVKTVKFDMCSLNLISVEHILVDLKLQKNNCEHNIDYDNETANIILLYPAIYQNYNDSYNILLNIAKTYLRIEKLKELND